LHEEGISANPFFMVQFHTRETSRYSFILGTVSLLGTVSHTWIHCVMCNQRQRTACRGYTKASPCFWSPIMWIIQSIFSDVLLLCFFYGLIFYKLNFLEKYDFVGKLLKPGEEPTDYSDVSDSETDKEKKKDD